MIVTLDWTEWLEDLRVRRPADVAAYLESLPADRTALTVDTDDPASFERVLVWEQQYTMNQLVHLFNALSPTAPAHKFSGTAQAVQRIGLRIIDVSRDLELTTVDPIVSPPITMSTQQEEGSTMPREAKMGPFSPVRADSHLGRIVAAVLGAATPLTVSEVGSLVGLTAEQVITQLRAARTAKGIGHDVGKESRIVTLSLPNGIDASNVFISPKVQVAKEPKADRVYKLGKHKKVRRNSKIGRIVDAAIDGGSTIGDVAALAEVTPDELVAHLKSMRRTHGIDHEIVDGVVTLKVPDGADPFIAVGEKPARAPSTGEPRQGKTAKLDAVAATGVMPEKPIVTSETNKHRQKHFDELAAHAEAGDWDKVAAKHMAGIDSYSAMINRYRDRLLSAHAAQVAGTQQAAE